MIERAGRIRDILTQGFRNKRQDLARRSEVEKQPHFFALNYINREDEAISFGFPAEWTTDHGYKAVLASDMHLKEENQSIVDPDLYEQIVAIARKKTAADRLHFGNALLWQPKPYRRFPRPTPLLLVQLLRESGPFSEDEQHLRRAPNGQMLEEIPQAKTYLILSEEEFNPSGIHVAFGVVDSQDTSLKT